jgi:hypothetical protein
MELIWVEEACHLTQDRIDHADSICNDLYNQPISTQEIDGRTYAAVGFDQWSASGLAVAWAEENTRDSIFQAFQKKRNIRNNRD